MGRTSKLTEKQWESIGQRLMDGEPARALAREFGISDAAIRKRFSTQHEQIKTVVNQMVTAELSFKALPIGSQIKARTLADRLKSISEHMAGAAEYGAMTAHRLAGIAHGQSDKVDDADPLASEDVIRSINILMGTANRSAEIAVKLLGANKDAIPDDDAPTPVSITFGVQDAKRYDDNKSDA